MRFVTLPPRELEPAQVGQAGPSRLEEAFARGDWVVLACCEVSPLPGGMIEAVGGCLPRVG
jgi:hypothetical protein